MSKRKSDNIPDLLTINQNLNYVNNFIINHTYTNPLNLDKIFVKNNHIYFDAVVNDDTITNLIEYIDLISKHEKFNLFEKRILLHINSKGGYIGPAVRFFEYSKICNIDIISIIEVECCDCGLIISAACNYRLIKKSAIIRISKYIPNENYNYWGYFKQCENNCSDNSILKNTIYKIFTESLDTKLTSEKLQAYLYLNNEFHSKKVKKMGIVDEII